MFGSEIAAEFVYDILAGAPEVVSATGGRIENLAVASGALPACIHYAETGPYGGPVDTTGVIDAEQLSYVVRFVCEGVSTEPIRLAATRALAALNGAEGTVSYDGDDYGLTVLATGEFVLPIPPEDGRFYRGLGFYLQIDVMRGG